MGKRGPTTPRVQGIRNGTAKERKAAARHAARTTGRWLKWFPPGYQNRAARRPDILWARWKTRRAGYVAPEAP